MDAAKLLAAVQGYGAAISVEAGDLVLYSGEHLPVDIKTELRAHKAELINHMAANDLPLADNLRALGRPIALEVEGKVVAWLVSDADAVARTDLNPRFTAAESEVLAQFNGQGMYDLIEMKAKLGGTLGPDATQPQANRR